MKVYILHFEVYDWHFKTDTKVLGTYASEEDVKKELDRIKEKCLSNGPDTIITEHEDGKGFTSSSSFGSMTVLPAAWFYKEQELIGHYSGD